MGRQILILTGLAGMLFAAPAVADFKQDYLNAVKALNKGDVQEAISEFRSAIADNPQADPAVRFYGMRREPYLPHFFLGNALYQAGDCVGAMQAWQTAEQQGVAASAGEGAALAANMANCASVTVDLTEFIAAAGTAIDGLEAAIGRYSDLSGEPLLRNEWSNRWQPEQATAESLAASLRRDLSAAEQASDQAAMETVTQQARTETNRINGLRDLALATVEDLRANQAERLAAEREQAERELRQAIASAGSVQQPAGASEQMVALKRDLDSQLQRAEGISSSASALNLRELAQGINSTIRRLEEARQNWQAEMQTLAERTPPPELKQIAESYFAGDYQAVNRSANPDRFDEPRPRVQALLFRAAANFSLYVLSGEQNSALLRQAETDIREIKRINGEFSPYIAAFSPSFIELFRRTG